jgi:hypothetical protein
MRTRRSPRNQERLWRALGGPPGTQPKKTRLPSRAEARAWLFPKATAEVRERWQHGMMTREEVAEAIEGLMDFDASASRTERNRVMADAKLIAHRGAEIVTREQLVNYPTPPATDTFKPVGHAELVATLTQVMQDRGLYIVREQFAVQSQKLFGTFDLEWQKMEEFGAAVGFRHANDKSMPIQIAVGARVFVCDNMSFLGELIHTRKHTAKLDLGVELDSAMYRYIQGYRKLLDDITVQKETIMEDRKAKTLIYDIFRQKIVPMRLFHPVVYSWEDSSKQHAPTGWLLHNCFTSHMQKLAPAPKFRATARLGKFFASKF